MSKITKRAPRVKIVKRMGRPITLPDFFLKLSTKLGGVEAAAKAIGKSDRQFRRIAHKESLLTDTTRIVLAGLAETHKLTKEFQEWDKTKV